MLAAIEDQKDSLARNECEKPRQRILCLFEALEGRSDGRDDQRAVTERAEVGEVDRFVKFGRHCVSYGDGDCCFADAAGTHDTDETSGHDLRAQCSYGLIAA